MNTRAREDMAAGSRRPGRHSYGGVLLVGPMSDGPLTGGVETGIRLLMESYLVQKRQLQFFNSLVISQPRMAFIRRLARHAAIIWRLGRRIVQMRPDVVHVKASEGRNFLQGVAYCAVARVLGYRALLQIHGGSFDAWYAECGRVGRAAIRLGLRVPHELIVLSAYWASVLTGLAPRRPLHVIPNGVPLDACQPGRRSCDRNLHVVTLGAIGRRKGYFDIVKSAAQLRNGAVTFTFAGPDEFPGETAALHELIAKEGVADRIRILNAVDGADKWRLLGEADVFLLPSYNENMPNAVLEAMAASLPIVCTKIGAVPEMVGRGEGALFIEAGDSSGMAAALITLAEGPALRRAMGEANRAIVSRRFAIDRVISAFDELYGRTGSAPVPRVEKQTVVG